MELSVPNLFLDFGFWILDLEQFPAARYLAPAATAAEVISARHGAVNQIIGTILRTRPAGPGWDISDSLVEISATVDR